MLAVSLSQPWSLKRRFHSETCRTTYFGWLASAAIRLQLHVQPQCAGYLPLTRLVKSSVSSPTRRTGATDP